MNNLSFQIIDWYTEENEDQYMIKMFGRTEDGKSVCVSTNFQPYFFVKVDGVRKANILEFYNKLPNVVDYNIVKKKEIKIDPKRQIKGVK